MGGIKGCVSDELEEELTKLLSKINHCIKYYKCWQYTLIQVHFKNLIFSTRVGTKVCIKNALKQAE